MARAFLLVLSVTFVGFSCGEDNLAPAVFGGTYTLVALNDQSLPSDAYPPGGCCLTLSGSVTFTVDSYDLRTSHRHANTDITFVNSEQGTYTRDGDSLSFTPTGAGGVSLPYLLGPGTVSADNRTVTLLYGDAGPGSTLIRARFRL